MIPLAGAEEMRHADQRAVASGTSLELLIERAGRAAADAVLAHFPEGSLREKRVVVFAGKGNNGADGRAAGRHLAEAGARVETFSAEDASAFSARAREAAASCDVLLDALLGTGARLPLEGELAVLVTNLADLRANPTRPWILSLDLPSGRSADLGEENGPCVHPDGTVVFAAMKPGLVLEPGAGACGEIVYAPIDFPSEALKDLPGSVFERRDLAQGGWGAVPPRGRSSHKGDARLVLLGGTEGMSGALALAADGAMSIGTGYLHLAAPESNLPTLSILVPEAIKIPLPDAQGHVAGASPRLLYVVSHAHAVVVGPGLGRGGSVATVLREVLVAAAGSHLDERGGAEAGGRGGAEVVIDGDALFALAEDHRLRALLRRAPVLTPHAAEAAKLLGCTPAQVERNRIGSAREIARRFEAVCLLKGRPNIVAAPAKTGRGQEPAPGPYIVVPFGNERLATAGSGDVLAGVLGALLARGGEPVRAACAAAALHGIAAEEAPHAPYGLRMRDLSGEIRRVAAATAR